MDARTSAATARASARTGSWQAWAVALRPQSLPVAVSPVLVGATLGYARHGAIDALAAVLVFAAALLMQLITNLQNDVGFTVRSGPTPVAHSGLPRATTRGWLGVREVRAAIAGLALVAVAVGLALVAYRGWPVLAIGTVSLLAALAYMGGPRPIAYTPFGELTVFIFFGLVAVLGTDWVLTGGVGAASALAAVAIGSLASVVLTVNNHRDIEHDKLVGRRTFAVAFGPHASRRLFDALLGIPFALLPVIAWLAGTLGLLLPLLLTPVALRLRRDFVACEPGSAYNVVLLRSLRLELWFAALMAAGTLLGKAGF